LSRWLRFAEPIAELNLLQDLIKDLKSELGGKFEKLVLALMENPYEYLAHELERAMKGIGTNEDVLTEVSLSKIASILQVSCSNNLVI